MINPDQYLRSLIGTLLCLLGFVCFAQEEDLQFERYNIGDGLISSVITSMCHDPDGFLWIGTMSGLSRFDGTEFVNYTADPGDSCSLNDNHVIKLTTGPSGDLYWISRYGWSRLRRDDQCVEYYPADTAFFGNAANVYSEILIAQDESVWLGTTKGITHVSDDGSERKHFPYDLTGAHPGEIRSLIPDEKGSNKLIAYTSGKKYAFDCMTGVFQEMNFDPQDLTWPNFALASEPAFTDSARWYGTWGNGLVEYHVPSDSWRIYHSPRGRQFVDPGLGPIPFDVVRAIMVQKPHTLWVGYTSGLGLISLHDRTLKMYESDPADPSSISNNSIAAIHSYKDDVIYLGTSNGLNAYHKKPRPLRRYDPLGDLRSSSKVEPDLMLFCARIMLDEETLMYSDVEIGGLSFLNINSGKFWHKDFSDDDNKRQIFYDCVRLPDSTVLLGTGSDVFAYDPASVDLKPYHSQLRRTVLENGMGTRNIVKAGDDGIWIFDVRRIAFLDQYGDVFAMRAKDHGLNLLRTIIPVASDTAILYEETEAYLIALRNGSVLKLQVSEPLGSYPHQGNFSNGAVWVPTSNSGIYHYVLSGDSLVLKDHFTTLSGLPTNNISRLAFSPNGFLWGMSNSGVVRIDTATEYVRTYDQRDGLSLVQLDEAMVFTEDGRMIFDDRRFLYAVNTSARQEFNGKAYVDYMESADSIYVVAHNPVKLRPNENDLTFKMGIIDHIHGSRDQLFYCLDDFDKDWQMAGRDRTARYTNLDPGSYTLKVRARNPDGYYSETEHLKFAIAPTIYQQTWFIPALIGLTLIGLYSFYRYRIRSMQRAEELRVKHNREVAELELQALRSQMNPHFMFNSLNSIKTYILKAKADQAAEYLSSFAHLIRMILQNSREKKITVEEELETLMLYIELEQLRFKNGFEFHCQIDDVVNLGTITIPPMILQPYVENAIWHGLLHKDGERHLSLRFSGDNGALICTIEDNGIGREAAAEIKSKSATKYKSMGMGITSDRILLMNKMDAMGIEVDIRDKRDHNGPTGTIVQIKIPNESNTH